MNTYLLWGIVLYLVDFLFVKETRRLYTIEKNIGDIYDVYVCYVNIFHLCWSDMTYWGLVELICLMCVKYVCCCIIFVL